MSDSPDLDQLAEWTPSPLYRAARSFACYRNSTTPTDLAHALRIPWNRAASLLEELEADRLLGFRLSFGRLTWSPHLPVDEDRVARFRQARTAPPAPLATAPLVPSPPSPLPPRKPAPPPRRRLLSPSAVTPTLTRHHIAGRHRGPIFDCHRCAEAQKP